MDIVTLAMAEDYTDEKVGGGGSGGISDVAEGGYGRIKSVNKIVARYDAPTGEIITIGEYKAAKHSDEVIDLNTVRMYLYRNPAYTSNDPEFGDHIVVPNPGSIRVDCVGDTQFLYVMGTYPEGVDRCLLISTPDGFYDVVADVYAVYYSYQCPELVPIDEEFIPEKFATKSYVEGETASTLSKAKEYVDEKIPANVLQIPFVYIPEALVPGGEVQITDADSVATLYRRSGPVGVYLKLMLDEETTNDIFCIFNQIIARYADGSSSASYQYMHGPIVLSIVEVDDHYALYCEVGGLE